MQHGRHEEVEVAEELAPVGIVRHVAEGVHVDQRAHDRDQEDEHDGQLVELEGHVRLEGPSEHQENRVWPNVRCSGEFCIIPRSNRRPRTADPATVRTPRYGPQELARRPPKSSTAAPARGSAMSTQMRENTLGGHELYHFAVLSLVDSRAAGACRVVVTSVGQYFRRFGSSMDTDRRDRKMTRMMASPTTTSAAATTMT